MTLLSFSFFLMLFFSIILYYVFKGKQKYILLATSIFFFCCVSKGKMLYMLSILLAVILVAYFGALWIQKTDGRKKTAAICVSILILVLNLVVLKYLFNLGELFLSLFKNPHDISFLEFAAPIGISYFTLSAIGYLLDVYWQSYSAAKNPFDVALFIAYFPAIVSGPVLRFNLMEAQINSQHKLHYDNIDYGLRRMLWGYFKKTVISERFAVIVNSVFSSYTSFSGYEIFFALLCYAFQLYTDFSGCMDIIIGASKLFDISLPENFNAPFLSKTIPEFWRRWHISLGNWFKDYVMYPILKTDTFQKIGQKSKKILGKKYGKKIPTLLSTFVLWFLIGIWHGGTGYYFMASAVIPCVLLTLSDLFEPLVTSFCKKTKMNRECFSFVLFQRIRTMILMLLVWLFVCSQSVVGGFEIIKHSLSTLELSYLKNISISEFGLSIKGMSILTVGVVILYISDYLKDKNSSVYLALNNQNKIFKYGILYCEVFIIALFGLIGNSPFIYFQF